MRLSPLSTAKLLLRTLCRRCLERVLVKLHPCLAGRGRSFDVVFHHDWQAVPQHLVGRARIASQIEQHRSCTMPAAVASAPAGTDRLREWRDVLRHESTVLDRPAVWAREEPSRDRSTGLLAPREHQGLHWLNQWQRPLGLVRLQRSRHTLHYGLLHLDLSI